MGLRDKILQAQDLKGETINVPEWDVDIEVCGISGKARANLLKIGFTGDILDLEKMYPVLLSESLRDPETKEKIFKPEDYDALLEKNGAVIERLSRIAARKAGLLTGSIGEAEKNS